MDGLELWQIVQVILWLPVINRLEILSAVYPYDEDRLAFAPIPVFVFEDRYECPSLLYGSYNFCARLFSQCSEALSVVRINANTIDVGP